MKKRILSLALIGTMTFGATYLNTVEAASFRNFNKSITQSTVEKPIIDESISEEKLGSEIDLESEAINVKEFGAVANADYYNPTNGNYYSDSSFTTPATDATAAINEAIAYASENGIKVVYIPEGNYLIDAKGEKRHYDFEYAVSGGIQIESNMELRLSENAKLVTNTVDVSGYSLITVDNKENVKISGGKIVGDILTHPADMHNYCHGITIANASKNVVVEDIEITECEDDGIMIVDYFSELSGGKHAKDIEIRRVKSHGNGRQGLTISTGSNITVEDSEFSRQTKHSPMSGIDIEIESYDHVGVENVKIKNNKFDGNAYSGVVFSNMFNDKPRSMSKNLEISGNTINGSRFGVIAAGKAIGLNISKNDVKLDHMTINEFSTGVGSTSSESVDVTISDNKVMSEKIGNYSMGVIVMSPSTVVKGNTFTGQRTGVVINTDGVKVFENIITDIQGKVFDVAGQGNDISNNQVK